MKLDPDLMPRKFKMSGRKLMVGIPCYWMLPYQFLASFADLLTRLYEINITVHIKIVSEPYIDFARNKIVAAANEKNCDWVLFLDQDIQFPDTIFEQLAAHKVDIVSGLYHLKAPPYSPLLYDFVGTKAGLDDWLIAPRHDYEDGLVECGAVGMGATLITRHAFREVVRYQLSMDPPMEDPACFKQYSPVGEDIWFCKFAQWAGLKVHCDTTMKLKHVGLMAVDETHFKIGNRYGTLERALECLDIAEEEELLRNRLPVEVESLDLESAILHG